MHNLYTNTALGLMVYNLMAEIQLVNFLSGHVYIWGGSVYHNSEVRYASLAIRPEYDNRRQDDVAQIFYRLEQLVHTAGTCIVLNNRNPLG
jgi:hypothetical protein